MISLDEAKSNYRDLAEAYLREVYSIDSLEKGFMNSKGNFMVPTGIDHLITLYNYPRVENLSEEEFEFLSKISEEQPKEDNMDSVISFIERTYRKVLYLPGWEHGDGRTGEFYPSIHGEAVLPVDSIVFRFHDSIPNIPIDKINVEEEDRKTRIFLNVKAQFEKLANKENKDYVWLLRF